MSFSTRALEEDEAKIDNLLHKVHRSSKLIEQLNNQIISINDQGFLDKDYVVERAQKIDILIKTIINLVLLADDIDITDEEVTEDIEAQLKQMLGHAITDIREINNYLDQANSK